MGIIVSRETWMECDTLGCKEKSFPHIDQSVAVHIAYKQGWHKDQNNGNTICPKCLNNEIVQLGRPKLPDLPEAVGFITREHETPGHLVADGGKIISVAYLTTDDPLSGKIYTKKQLLEYAQLVLEVNGFF